MVERNVGWTETTFDELFPRVHKVALGFAVGFTTGVSLWLLTIYHVMAQPRGVPLFLLAPYLYGYDITWAGAFSGFAWAGALGFVAGWLVGLVHNATLDIWLLAIRQRTDLSLKRHFLDHIR